MDNINDRLRSVLKKDKKLNFVNPFYFYGGKNFQTKIGSDNTEILGIAIIEGTNDYGAIIKNRTTLIPLDSLPTSVAKEMIKRVTNDEYLIVSLKDDNEEEDEGKSILMQHYDELYNDCVNQIIKFLKNHQLGGYYKNIIELDTRSFNLTWKKVYDINLISYNEDKKCLALQLGEVGNEECITKYSGIENLLNLIEQLDEIKKQEQELIKQNLLELSKIKTNYISQYLCNDSDIQFFMKVYNKLNESKELEYEIEDNDDPTSIKNILISKLVTGDSDFYNVRKLYINWDVIYVINKIYDRMKN